MNIKRTNKSLLLSTSIREKILFIIPLFISIWCIITFFYGIWNGSMLVNQSISNNVEPFIIFFNVLFLILAIIIFGGTSFLLTLSSLSSLLNFKKIIIHSSTIEFNIKKYLFREIKDRIESSNINKIKTIQDESSDFCQLLIEEKTGDVFEIDSGYGSEEMNHLNEIGQEIANFRNVNFKKNEFLPFIEEEEEENSKEEKDRE